MLFYYIIYGLIGAGIILIFSTHIVNLFKRIYGQRRKIPHLITKFAKYRKKSLRKKVNLINNGRKVNFFESSYSTMTEILTKTGEGSKIKRFRKICLCCGALGFLIALLLKSFLLIPILSVGLALLPMWLLKFKQFRFTLKSNSELSVALSTVSSSYVRSENLLLSVKENIDFMNEPVKSAFNSFIVDCGISADIGENIRKLKSRLDNKIFQLWCDNLIICRSNINQKHTLKSIVEQFASEKSLWEELITELKKPIFTLSLSIVLCFCAFPIVYMLGNSFGMTTDAMTEIMFESINGQIIIVLFALILFYGINKAINLSTKME